MDPTTAENSSIEFGSAAGEGFFGIETTNSATLPGWGMKLHGGASTELDDEVMMLFAPTSSRALGLPQTIYDAYWNQLTELGCTDGESASCPCDAETDIDATFPALQLQLCVDAADHDELESEEESLLNIDIPASVFMVNGGSSCSLSLTTDLVDGTEAYQMPLEVVDFYDINLDLTNSAISFKLNSANAGGALESSTVTHEDDEEDSAMKAAVTLASLATASLLF